MKKIAFLTKDLSIFGGVERVIDSLSCSLSNNYDCEILTLYDAKREVELNQKKITTFDLNKRKGIIFKIGNHIKTIVKLVIAFNSNQYDFIVANSPSLSCLSLLSKKIAFKSEVKIICYEHNKFDFPNKYWKFLRKHLFKYSHATLALTKDSYDDYSSINANPVLIPNPLTIDIGNRSRCIGFNVLSVGRLTYQKGFDILIDIWGIVVKNNELAHLNIVGDGEERYLLEKKIKELGLDDHVTLHGSKYNISEYYESNDLYVMTSRYEGFGLVLVEAMAHALPVISFNCKSGPSDIITSGYNGVLIDEGDIETFAKTIVSLLDDKIRAHEMSLNAKISTKKYSIETIKNRWIDDILNDKSIK